MDCPPKKSGRCGEIAVSGGSTVVAMLFHFIICPLLWPIV